jgi:hypothetical protein
MLAHVKVALLGVILVAAVGLVQELRVQSLKTELAEAKNELTVLEKQHVETIAEQQANLITAQENAQKAEQALQDYVNTEGRKKDEQVKAANAVAADMSRRLRLATEEARKLASQIREGSATAGTQGTVARSDDTLVPATIGQEDVDEATRADDIRLSLLECYNVYRKARKTIDDYNAKLDSAPVREASQTGEDAP